MTYKPIRTARDVACPQCNAAPGKLVEVEQREEEYRNLRAERDRYVARVKLLEQRLASILEIAEGRSVEEELDRVEAPSVLDGTDPLRGLPP